MGGGGLKDNGGENNQATSDMGQLGKGKRNLGGIR